MSMLSMLIDRLRSHADLYDGKTKPPMAHELQRPYLAQELREAADIIWQLRDDLQRANDAVQDAEHDESMAWDRVRKAERENAKLREMVRDYKRCSVHADCAKCEYDGKLSEHCPYSPCFPDVDELCELGIEVHE